ncbi:MAG: FHA domain-containing protein [Bradymonadaceae bacterium]|nr:FHA domain-containing protein [Lujinxingiaceae bacterium]
MRVVCNETMWTATPDGIERTLSSDLRTTRPALSSRDFESLDDGSEASIEEYVDLDVLRGWKEQRDPELVAAHALPALAELIHLDASGRQIASEPIHGPDVVVGRFHPQYGPVDILLGSLRDHESYKLGAPHLYLVLDRAGNWDLRPLSPTATTQLKEAPITDNARHYRIDHGDELHLGVARFVFERLSTTLDTWFGRYEALLQRAGGPSLMLMRAGGVCGPYIGLEKSRAYVIGRTFPGRGDVPGTEDWPRFAQPEWDLSGLPEKERKHLGFRHARLKFVDESWCVEPVCTRQRTFVNRVAISTITALESGDEVGMGSVLFHFHDESAVVLPRSKKIHLPAVVDWSDGHVSRTPGRPAPAPPYGDA